MKRAGVTLLVLFLAGCAAVNVSGNGEPVVTPSIASASVVARTPTVFLSATATPILLTQTPNPLTGTPMPSATPRVNVALKPGTGIRLTSIQMFDSQRGWGFDSDSHILRTQNGGKTWQDVTPPTGYYNPAGFFALDADNAWATFTIGLYLEPTTAHTWHTQDGGQMWTQSQEFRLDLDQYGELYPSGFYLPQRMQFVDRQTGWLLAAVAYNMNSARPLLFQTTDSGHTWTTINSRIEFPDACVSVGFVFIDPQTGWVGGNCFAQGVVSNTVSFFVLPDGWGIYKTLDGGRSYTQKTFMPVPEEFQQLDLLKKEGNCGETRIELFAEHVIGIEWGCSIFTPLKPDYQYFALSADDGRTWTSWKSAGNESFLDAQHGWRLLSTGELQQTSDAGVSWATIKNVTWNEADFDFVDEQEGWAIVSIRGTGALLHTNNGGKTWQDLHPLIGP